MRIFKSKVNCLRVLQTLLVTIAALGIWHVLVLYKVIPFFPFPTAVAETIYSDLSKISSDMLSTSVRAISIAHKHFRLVSSRCRSRQRGKSEMKRSKINEQLQWAIGLLEENNLRLPGFAYWAMDEWRRRKQDTAVIRRVMQGWDITDFGSGRFPEIGAVLFTVRNGLLDNSGIGTPYAEKYIMCHESQSLPMHYHACKTEDIINRGGGVLSLRFYQANIEGMVDYESDVDICSDGIPLHLKAGEELLVEKGNSVTITPRIYHMFGAKKGAGDLIVGEISSINDDYTDNYFAEPAERFAQIEEDCPKLYPLCNEY